MQQLNVDYHVIKGDGIIELRFEHHFDQTDIEIIAELLRSKLTSVKVLEHVEGVDRECFRLEINGVELNLNFEIYSQSCWFEATVEADNSSLNELVQYL